MPGPVRKQALPDITYSGLRNGEAQPLMIIPPRPPGCRKCRPLAFFSLLRRVPCPGGYIHFIVLVMCQEQGMGDRIYVEGPGGAAAAPGKVQRKFAQTKSEFLSRICSNTL